MGEFNSDDHYFYYCGQESLRRNVVALIVNKRVLNAATWAQSQKQQDYLVALAWCGQVGRCMAASLYLMLCLTPAVWPMGCFLLKPVLISSYIF